MKKIFRISEVIINLLIRSKLEGDKCDSFVDIVSALSEIGLKEYEAREVQRSFERIGDNLAVSCEKILEKSSVKAERNEIVLEEVLEAYSRLELNYEKLFEVLNSADKLKRILLMANQAYKSDLDLIEQEVYERLIDYTADFIVNAAVSMPEFTTHGIKRLVAMLDDLGDKINKIIEQLDKVNDSVEDKSVKVQKFERNYRKKIISQYSYISLFGVGGLEREYKRYQLDIAYVQLEICYKNTDSSINIGQLFRKAQYIWLVGEAGSGKTTFLQWLAVCAAEGTQEIEGLRDSIPILIELRKTNGAPKGLKECIESVMRDSSFEIPDGWIDELLETGRFLFLIDGFDEIDERAREKALDWLQEIDVKNKCKKIFASRPQVKERPVLKSGLAEVRILPMDKKRIKCFIEYWHRAVLVEQLKVDLNDVKHISFKLYEKINQAEALQKLASNPLLCAMICALHYRNDMNLPLSKRELYEECCKMLLEKRDSEREISVHKLGLNYERKKIIMARLAYWMMKNNHVEIDKSQAVNSIERTLSGMNIEKIDSEIAFRYLLERSGLLRETEINKIDFIHRTFQEYLTAYEISREEDWGYLKEKVGDDTWEETIGMGVGFAKKDIASDIIEFTLKKGKLRQEENKYLFLAITYLAGAIEVKEELRIKIEQQVEELIPPMEMECFNLAKAGDLAIPFLKYKNGYDTDERLGCIRTLRLIGSEKALVAATSYFERCMTKAEVREMGMLFEQFTDNILRQHDIPYCLKKYIEDICGNMVIMHDSFIRVINLLLEDENSEAFSRVTEVQIVDYQESSFRKEVFPKVRTLRIEGNFDELPVLDNFQMLDGLYLLCRNDKFSIYDLKDYENICNVEEFSILLERSEYIGGRDLRFLRNCTNLRIILLNSLSEFYFDSLDELDKLERLEIGAEFVLELEFSMLPSHIKELVVYMPKVYESQSYIVEEQVDVPMHFECYEDLIESMDYFGDMNI